MKNLLVYIWHLAVVIAVATGGGAELQRGAADLVTRTAPDKPCEPRHYVTVNFYAISACVSGTEIVYQGYAVLSQTLPPAGEETFELPASTIEECVQLAAEAGLAAFEFNSKCLAYSTSNRFRKCYIFCYRVIYVTSHSFPKEPRLVTFDEAPWKPGAYNDTREYRLEKLIYLDESNMPQPAVAGLSYDPVFYRSGYSYATLQNGSIFAFSPSDVDLFSCLYYDGDAGMPTLVSPVYFNYTNVVYYFLERCGDTIRLPESVMSDHLERVNPIILYSHRGYGCSEFPRNSNVDCTVNIEYGEKYFVNVVTRGLNGPDGGCDGLTLTVEEGDTERDICTTVARPRGLDSPPNGGRMAFTLRGSTAETRLGFYFTFGDLP